MTREDNPPSLIAKIAAGQAAAELIENGMHVGLGTGSTASYFIDALSVRCKKGLKIHAVASSKQSMQQAQKLGIPLIDESLVSFLDITVDGADEIDHKKNMIKGGGGALLREKLMAYSSREMIVVVDENKLVDQLGAFPVPVEISSFIYRTTLFRLNNHGYHGVLRLNRDGTIYSTDNGNYIFDIQFNDPIVDPKIEDEKLKQIVGVIETGLFYHVAGRVVVGYFDGLAKVHEKSRD